MQTYLSTINELLVKWYAIIMADPLYKALFIAACVAATIWLLMLVYYQIKVVRLRGKLRKVALAHESVRKQLGSELDMAKEQLQQTAIELDAKNIQLAQLETDRLASQALITRANALEQKAKQLVTNLQTEFFLPAMSEIEASDLAQSLHFVIQNVTDRLKTAQQQHLEVSQQRQQEQQTLLEKETLIADLHGKLATHVNQIQILENDFKAQKSNWQQEQAQLHQEIQLVQSNHQEVLSKIAQAEAVKPQVNAPPVSVTPAATTQAQPTISESVSAPIVQVVAPVEETIHTIVANVGEVAAEVEDAAESAVAKAGNQFSKFFGSMKGLGGKKSVLQESVTSVEAVVEEAVEEVQAQVSHAVEVVEELVTDTQEGSQVSRFFGSLKNLGSAKKTTVEEVITKVEQISPAAVEVVENVSENATGGLSKLKGMLNFKKTPVKIKEEVVIKVEQAVSPVTVEVVESVSANTTDGVSKLKGMLGFKKAPAKVKAEPEVVVESEDLLDSMVEKLEASNINKLVPKKLKDIYHKIMSV